MRRHIALSSFLIAGLSCLGLPPPLPGLGDDGTSSDGNIGSTSGDGTSGGSIASSGFDTSSGSVGSSGGSETSSGVAETTAGMEPPEAPVLELSFSQVKQFDFSWAAVAGAEYYQIEESAGFGEPFVQVDGNIVGESVSITVPLHFRYEASYRLYACNVAGQCSLPSPPVSAVGSLAEAVGY